jgi:putative DNA primase/helicase
MMGDAWKGNNRIFRTYLKGGGKDGKRCVDRHKGIGQVRTFEDASQFANFGAVCNEGYIDISFDDAEMSEAFLNMAEQNQWRCMCLENPVNHHLHTYWKDTAHRITKFNKDLNLACGLVADIHGGETYIPLKVNGVDRFPPVYDIYEDEEYQEVPEELIPVQTNIKLWKSKEGDGRNSDLYGYILILQSQLQMSDDRIRELYKECINRFILGDKMSDAELDVILRDESFQKQIIPSFWSGASFLHDKFAEYLKDICDVVLINDQLHIYKDGVYVNAKRDIESQMIQLVPKLKKTQRRETMDYLELIAEPKHMSSARYIAFMNGIYDLVTNTLLPFSKDIIITNKLPWNYNPTAYSELVDKSLNEWSCKDEKIRAVLEECVGACMYRSALLAGGKAFILTGDKANGKSTFFTIVNCLLGNENIASLDLKELGDRFSTAMIFGKLANIGDDISDDFIPDTSFFKKVVTGNRIKAERKGIDPFEFNPYCKLLFSANDIPRMKDKTGAVMRRLMIIPFNAVFEKPDPFISEKLCEREAMEYLALLGIKGLLRVKQSNSFTTSQKIIEKIEEYDIENNPVLGFIKETDDEFIIHQPTADVYRRYQLFCQENGYQPIGNGNFSKMINKKKHLKVVQRKIGGKNTKIFERDDD